jgi:hypothetical protein
LCRGTHEDVSKADGKMNKISIRPELI